VKDWKQHKGMCRAYAIDSFNNYLVEKWGGVPTFIEWCQQYMNNVFTMEKRELAPIPVEAIIFLAKLVRLNPAGTFQPLLCEVVIVVTVIAIYCQKTTPETLLEWGRTQLQNMMESPHQICKELVWFTYGRLLIVMKRYDEVRDIIVHFDIMEWELTGTQKAHLLFEVARWSSILGLIDIRLSLLRKAISLTNWTRARLTYEIAVLEVYFNRGMYNEIIQACEGMKDNKVRYAILTAALCEIGEFEKAQQVSFEALSAYQKLVDEYPQNIDFRIKLAHILSILSITHASNNKYREAEDYLFRAVDNLHDAKATCQDLPWKLIGHYTCVAITAVYENRGEIHECVAAQLDAQMVRLGEIIHPDMARRRATMMMKTDYPTEEVEALFRYIIDRYNEYFGGEYVCIPHPLIESLNRGMTLYGRFLEEHERHEEATIVRAGVEEYDAIKEALIQHALQEVRETRKSKRMKKKKKSGKARRKAKLKSRSKEQEEEEEEEKKEESELKCAICLDPFEEEETNTTICGHLYHKECLDDWMSTCQRKNWRPSCPMCRASLVV
jgi:tetratricopeptide (TPR) repeat protein